MLNKEGRGLNQSARLTRKRLENVKMIEEERRNRERYKRNLLANPNYKGPKKYRDNLALPQPKIKIKPKSEMDRVVHRTRLFNHLSPNRNLKNFHINDFYT